MTSPRLTEVALFTADVDGLTCFYERVLGLARDARSPRHAVFTLGGPLDLPWGRSAYLRDPDGRIVELT